MDSNHETALARAKNYFERAKAIAEKTKPAMAQRIDILPQAKDSKKPERGWIKLAAKTAS